MLEYYCQMYITAALTLLVILNLSSPGILPHVHPKSTHYSIFTLLFKQVKVKECNFELYISLYIV